MVRTILFDLDGTLVDTSAAVPAAYAATIAALGGPAVSAAEVVAAYSLGPTRAILEYFLGRELSSGEVQSYHQHLAQAGAIHAYPGVRRALEALHGRVALGVYSGAGTQSCRIVLERTRLATFFDVVVSGEDVSRPKPDPEGIVLAASRLGVPLATTAYVGDAPRDLEAARACGAVPVAAAWGHEFEPEVPPAQVLRDPSGLVGLVC